MVSTLFFFKKIVKWTFFFGMYHLENISFYAKYLHSVLGPTVREKILTFSFMLEI